MTSNQRKGAEGVQSRRLLTHSIYIATAEFFAGCCDTTECRSTEAFDVSDITFCICGCFVAAGLLFEVISIVRRRNVTKRNLKGHSMLHLQRTADTTICLLDCQYRVPEWQSPEWRLQLYRLWHQVDRSEPWALLAWRWHRRSLWLLRRFQTGRQQGRRGE